MKITKRENLKDKRKLKGRYEEDSIVIDACGEDSYLERNSKVRINKKRHYDLKGIG